MKMSPSHGAGRVRPGLVLICLAALALIPAGCREGSQAEVDIQTLQGEPIQPLAQTTPDEEAPSPTSPPDPSPQVSVPPLLALDSSSSEAPPPADPESVLELIETEDGAFLRVGFDRLSGFEVQVDEAILNPQTNQVEGATRTVQEQIPRPVLDLNDKAVALKGFMLPLKVEGGLVTELLIMKDQSMCCFGVTPQIHEWVSVKMVDRGVKPIMDQAVTLFGTLKVGEMRENGYLVGIYSMDGVNMAGPLDE